MQYPTHPLILFFISILFTATPTAARPSTPGAPSKSPHTINAPTRSQAETLTNEDLSYSYAKPPTSNTPETSNAPPLPKRTGGEGDNRIFQQRWLPSSTPKTSTPPPLPKRRGGEGDNRRWLPSIIPEKANLLSLPLPLNKRRGGEGDNRRWLPTSDSSLSATGIENFLTNPGGIVDNAREVLVMHDVSNGGSRGRERRELALEDEAVGERSTQRSHPRSLFTPRSAPIPVPW